LLFRRLTQRGFIVICVRPVLSGSHCGMRARTDLRAVLGLFALTACTTGAYAQQVPNEDELRSMYCGEVIRAEIGLQHHMISASDDAAGSATSAGLRQQWIDVSAELLQGLARLEVVRYRLQVYMLPRIGALDSHALASAIRQGETDFQESRALADRCAVQCGAAPATNQQPQGCGTSCGDNAPLARLSACENPPWLPALKGSR